jgi:hypothetical protein
MSYKTLVLELTDISGAVAYWFQPGDHEFEPYSGHDHVSSYATSTGWFQEADSDVINFSCKNLFRKRA